MSNPGWSALQIWPEVAADLKTDGDGQAVYQGKKLQTSAGPLASKSLKDVPIG